MKKNSVGSTVRRPRAIVEMAKAQGMSVPTLTKQILLFRKEYHHSIVQAARVASDKIGDATTRLYRDI